jgi:hypothetical protein
VGRPFQFQVITTGASPAARLGASDLPAGFDLDPMSGRISGTPIIEGDYAVTLTVTDGDTTASETLQLTFSADLARPIILSPSEVTLIPGQLFEYTIAAPAETDPSNRTFFALLGPLPPGLSFDPETGRIFGVFNNSSGDVAPTAVIPGDSLPNRGGGGGGTPQPLSGGVITNVQLFAGNPSGTGTVPLVFFLPQSGVVNIATRLAIGTGENVLIGGFIVTGNAPKKLIIRAMGSSLGGPNPVSGRLQDPTLELLEGNESLGTNDDWRSDQEQAIIATTIPPPDDREAAILAILNPGTYTAIVGGKEASTGIGLVEVYDLGTASLEASSNAKLSNLSTRGLVRTGDDVMIGGFIVSGGSTTTVLIRAIGPSLAFSGVAGVLEDPTLDFVDGNGSIILSNDDWRTGGQEQQILDTTVPPSDERESALVATIGPGGYTAIVRGNGGRIGVALVEVYVLK